MHRFWQGIGGMTEEIDEQCPDCEVPLLHGHDRMGYEQIQCPGCGAWKRVTDDELRERPLSDNGGEPVE